MIGPFTLSKLISLDESCTPVEEARNFPFCFSSGVVHDRTRGAPCRVSCRGQSQRLTLNDAILNLCETFSRSVASPSHIQDKTDHNWVQNTALMELSDMASWDSPRKLIPTVSPERIFANSAIGPGSVPAAVLLFCSWLSPF